MSLRNSAVVNPLFRLLALGVALLTGGGCHLMRTSVSKQGIIATVATVSTASHSNPLVDLRLTIKNLGNSIVKLPEIENQFLGAVIIQCRTNAFELRHVKVWNVLLHASFEPEWRPLIPSASHSYLIRLSDEYQSISDIIAYRSKTNLNQSASINSQTLQKLRQCDNYEVYCILDRFALTSNIVKVKLISP